MQQVKYPVFQESIRRLIARQRKSASSFARGLNINPCTVFAWTKGHRLPMRFLREILKDMYGESIRFDDEGS